jgi:Ca2+-binding RTX toxin-like protein
MLQSIRLGIPLGPIERILGTARTIHLREMLGADLGIEPIAGNGPSVIPAGAPIVVTGHSLGGHLALLFGRFFPEVTEHVYTYNAPGIGPQGELALRAMGIPPSPPSLVTNVSAVMGEEAISRIWSKPGETIGIATEPGRVLHQHSIVPLTDTLALYEAFGILSPGLANVADVSGIIQAASPYPEDSLEVTLDALGMLLGTGSSSTLIAQTGADRIERENYYRNLYALLDSRESGRDYRIESLAGKSAAEIASMAAADISVRYALDELNPFIARNASYSQFDGEFSGSWIAARAEMLAGVLEGNRLDQPFGLTGSDDSILYSDIDSGATFSMLSDAQAQIALPLHRSNQREAVQNALAQATYRRTVIFGSDSSTDGDDIAGLAGNDRLLGGGGADELDGLAGDDVLDGGEGNDVLRGGEGDDVLSGGAGADRLEGGSGQDTYLLDSFVDADTIVDRDGRVFLGEDVLTGGRGADGGAYVGADGRLTYVFEGDLDSGGTLTVNGSLRIEDFRNGDLGIRLWSTRDPGEDEPFVPVIDTILIGDYVYDEHIVAPPVPAVDEYGNPTPATRAAADPGRVDTYEQFRGTPGNTRFVGAEGDDILQDILSGDDWLDLGPGHDAGWGGEGNDLVEGGPGRDIVAGGRGDDVLYAGTRDTGAQDVDDAAVAVDGGDLLSGGDGDDLIYGDAASNLIEGGGGDDRIFAGAGDDGINSDGVELARNERYEIHPPINDWNIPSVDILWRPFTPLPTFELTPGSGPGSPGVWRIPTSSSQPGTVVVAGADDIDAGSGDDTIFAGGNDDIVQGGAGDDYIDMGTGRDHVRGGDGNDFIFLPTDSFGDFADGGEGDDTVLAEYTLGDNRFEGGAGNDLLKSGFGADVLVGGDGDDLIESIGDDVMFGDGGNDTLRASQGNPFLDGGAGTDLLFATLEIGGVATFRWGEGYGTDIGLAFFGDAILQIAGHVAPGDVAVSNQGQIMPGMLPYPDEFVAQLSKTVFSIEGGAQRFFLFQIPEELSELFGLPWSGDRTVLFADGTVWDDAYIDSLLVAPEDPEVLPLAGTDEADVVYGTAGAETLSGAAGDDFLAGDAGNDTYLYAEGDGFDRIEDVDATPGNADVLRFAEGIGSEDVSVFSIDDDYVLETNGGGVRLMAGRTAEGAIEHVEFANGTRWTLTDLEARAEVLPANRAPDMPESFGSVSTDPGNRVEFALPGDAVSDLDRFDAVNLYAITADGERLPEWLQFDAASRTLSGTPGQGDAGVHELLFIAADASGAAAAGSFTIQVGAAVPATEPAAPVVQVTSEAAEPLPQLPAVEPLGADVAVAPALSAPAPASRENDFDALATVNAALEAPRVFTDSAEPAFRDIQHRLDVLLQTGRTNLGERYAEAIREFEERRLEREEVPEPLPPTEEEIEAWNSAMHAWHDRHQGFAETEPGAADGVWGMGWGLIGPEGSLGGAGSASLSSLASANLHARLQGVASAPALSEGFQHLR